jgi:DNA-nicking Smr family endonuclease
MSGGDHDDEGGDEKAGRSENFADLIGETKPIATGPARAERPIRISNIPRPRETPSRSSSFRWPDPDEPRRAAAFGVSDKQLFALGRGDPEPEEKIDLHGLRRDAAGRLLADRIESARARGLRCVVVVHGRGQRAGTGEAILRDALPGWLSKTGCAEHLLCFAPAPNRHGGEGATLVLLRRP